MNGLRPHFFAGGVPLSRADFPGDSLRDWIAYTLAFSANVHFGDKDAALELFYSEADSIYERCEQEILSRFCREDPTPTQYLLTEEEYKEAEFLPVDFCDRGLIEVSYHCLSTKCVYGATLTVSQYNEWKEDARRACHHLNPCRYQTPMSPEKAFAQWLANDEAIGQLQEYVTRLCAQRMGCEFHLSQFYRQQEGRPERCLIAHGGGFYCLEFDTEDGRIMRIERLPFLSKEKAPGVQQSEA